MRIVMMGTGTFAEPTFEALLKHFPGEVVGLVTQPDRDVGRRSGSSRQIGVGMANIAKAHSLPVLQPASINSDEGLTQLAALNPDLLVVAAYGQILKPTVLSIPKLGAINVHASLLPKYRGAAPVAHAILNGETETGVTIIRITPGLDAGEMLAQAKIEIGSEESAGGLEHRLARIGDQLAVDVITRMKHGPIAGEKQDPALVTKAPKISKEMGLIDWMKPATEIKNHIRAMSPWPTAFTFFHRPGKEPMRVIIQNAMTAVRGPSRAGTIEIRPDSAITVATVDGAISIRYLKPAGKNLMDAAEFMRGYPITDECRFGPERLS